MKPFQILPLKRQSGSFFFSHSGRRSNFDTTFDAAFVWMLCAAGPAPILSAQLLIGLVRFSLNKNNNRASALLMKVLIKKQISFIIFWVVSFSSFFFNIAEAFVWTLDLTQRRQHPEVAGVTGPEVSASSPPPGEISLFGAKITGRPADERCVTPAAALFIYRWGRSSHSWRWHSSVLFACGRSDGCRRQEGESGSGSSRKVWGFSGKAPFWKKKKKQLFFCLSSAIASFFICDL